MGRSVHNMWLITNSCLCVFFLDIKVFMSPIATLVVGVFPVYFDLYLFLMCESKQSLLLNLEWTVVVHCSGGCWQVPARVHTIVVDTRLCWHIFTLNIAPSLLNAPCYSPLSTQLYSFLFAFICLLLVLNLSFCHSVCFSSRVCWPMSAPVFASTKGFDPNSTFLLLGFHYKAQFNRIIENRRFFRF